MTIEHTGSADRPSPERSVDNTTRPLESRIRAAEIQFRKPFADFARLEINCDRTRIGQLTSNLDGGAVVYLSLGGSRSRGIRMTLDNILNVAADRRRATVQQQRIGTSQKRLGAGERATMLTSVARDPVCVQTAALPGAATNAGNAVCRQ